MDLINDFRTRPAPMTTKTWYEEKQKIGERAIQLIEIGEKLHLRMKGERTRKEKRTDAKHFLEFEKHYYFLKRDCNVLHMARDLKGGSFLIPWIKLVLGILGISMSITWFIHMCIFMLPPPDQRVDPFLNNLFIELEDVGNGNFPLMGVLAYACYSFYLLWAVVKGNFKLGIRFLIFKIYPMEIGNTMMNAFLANTWVILLCSIPTVQFCTMAFPIYARYTSIDMMFGTQIKYLPWFKYFWENNVFIFVIVILNVLTLIYLCACPRDRGREVQAQLDAMAADNPY